MAYLLHQKYPKMGHALGIHGRGNLDEGNHLSVEGATHKIGFGGVMEISYGLSSVLMSAHCILYLDLLLLASDC